MKCWYGRARRLPPRAHLAHGVYVVLPTRSMMRTLWRRTSATVALLEEMKVA